METAESRKIVDRAAERLVRCIIYECSDTIARGFTFRQIEFLDKHFLCMYSISLVIVSHDNSGFFTFV